MSSLKLENAINQIGFTSLDGTNLEVFIEKVGESVSFFFCDKDNKFILKVT